MRAEREAKPSGFSYFIKSVKSSLYTKTSCKKLAELMKNIIYLHRE